MSSKELGWVLLPSNIFPQMTWPFLPSSFILFINRSPQDILQRMSLVSCSLSPFPLFSRLLWPTRVCEIRSFSSFLLYKKEDRRKRSLLSPFYTPATSFTIEWQYQRNSFPLLFGPFSLFHVTISRALTPKEYTMKGEFAPLISPLPTLLILCYLSWTLAHDKTVVRQESTPFAIYTSGILELITHTQFWRETVLFSTTSFLCDANIRWLTVFHETVFSGSFFISCWFLGPIFPTVCFPKYFVIPVFPIYSRKTIEMSTSSQGNQLKGTGKWWFCNGTL